MLFDLSIEIKAILKMAQDGAESIEIEKSIEKLCKKQKAIYKRLRSVESIMIIMKIYGDDYKALSRDLGKYLFIKDTVKNIKGDNSSNLAIMLRISKVLDRMLDNDYSEVFKEIESREIEAETDVVSS